MNQTYKTVAQYYPVLTHLRINNLSTMASNIQLNTNI